MAFRMYGAVRRVSHVLKVGAARPNDALPFDEFEDEPSAAGEASAAQVRLRCVAASLDGQRLSSQISDFHNCGVGSGSEDGLLTVGAAFPEQVVLSWGAASRSACLPCVSNSVGPHPFPFLFPQDRFVARPCVIRRSSQT